MKVEVYEVPDDLGFLLARSKNGVGLVAVVPGRRVPESFRLMGEGELGAPTETPLESCDLQPYSVEMDDGRLLLVAV